MLTYPPPGDTCLVHAGAGAGLLLTQIAVAGD
jgi:hypothetical protein